MTIADVNFDLSHVFATSEDCVHSYVSYFQSLESTKIIISNSVKMHKLASFLSKKSQQFQLPKHCFKWRQKALFSVLYVKCVLAVS